MELMNDAEFDDTVALFKKTGFQAQAQAAQLKGSKAGSGRPERIAKLKEVFKCFDLDQSGLLGRDELMIIGQERRKSGQGGGGEWTTLKNDRMLAKITAKGDKGLSGNITRDEFVAYFDQILPPDDTAFNQECQNFLGAAEQAQKTKKEQKEKRKEDRLNESSRSPPRPIERVETPPGTPPQRPAEHRGQMGAMDRHKRLKGIFEIFDLDKV